MRKIFADTGYWIALLNPDDDLHQKAKEIRLYRTCYANLTTGSREQGTGNTPNRD